MRRLLACAALATATFTAAPASAQTYCTPTVIGACVTYTCVDICGPEVSYDVYCDLDSHPRILLCDVIDGL